MQVTFDTNVWTRMVFPERHVNNPNYLSLVRIKDAIRSGQVRGFISEGFATVEAISKRNRAKFHAQNIPTVEVTPKVQGGGSSRCPSRSRPITASTLASVKNLRRAE